MLKNHEKSIECCNKVLEIKPDCWDTFSLIGICYTQLRDYNKAIEILEEAINKMKELNVNNPPKLYIFKIGIAKAKLESHKYEESIQLFKEAGELVTDNSTSHIVYQAQALSRYDKHDEAVTLIANALKEKPTDVLLNSLNNILIKGGKL